MFGEIKLQAVQADHRQYIDSQSQPRQSENNSDREKLNTGTSDQRSFPKAKAKVKREKSVKMIGSVIGENRAE